MTRSVKRPATYEDLLQVPDHLVAEIIDGELITSPRPAPRHAWTYSALLTELHSAFQQGRGGPGGWVILAEPELHLKDDVLVPDIAGWRKEHMPALPDAAFFTLAPDWLCEIVSPSTEHIDRERKLHIYARTRVKTVWLADPLKRMLEIYALVQGILARAAMHEGNAVVRAEPFEAVPLDLSRIWPDSPDARK